MLQIMKRRLAVRISETDALVAEFVAMLRKIIFVPPGGITSQTPIRDLGLDSLDLVEAALELEALIGRELPDGILSEARTVGDVAIRLAGRVPVLSLAA
jgi:acyl carrier protein